MNTVDDRVAETARDEPSVDGERRDEGERERDREAGPEEDVRETRVHSARDREHDDVVDDLHGRDRQRFRGEGDPGRAEHRHPRTEERHQREAIAKRVRKDDPEHEGYRVAKAEGGSGPKAEHLADAAPGEAVDCRLERQLVGARRFVAGVSHPCRSSSTAAYGSSERSATRATAAASRDSPTRPSSSRSKASRKSASTSARAAPRRRSRYSPDSRAQARCLSIASMSCGNPSPDWADVRRMGLFHGRSFARESICARSRAVSSAPGRSALFTTSTSAISSTPALIAWMSSPRPGTVTRQTVSATRTTSTSS